MLTLTQTSPTISHATTCEVPSQIAAHHAQGHYESLRLSHVNSAKTRTSTGKSGKASHSTEFKPARLSPVGAHLWTLSADQAALDIALDRMIDAVLGKA